MAYPDEIDVDFPRVSRDEATELCVYHLRMAAALFQAVPDDDNASLLAEIDRACCETLECEISPAKAWAQEILRIYNRMKTDD